VTGQPDPLRIDFHLLDRQIVDLNGVPVGKVDDVEIESTPDGYRVVALHVGMSALGRRMGGQLGRLLNWLARRGHPEGDPSPLRIPYEHVAEVGSHITLPLRVEILDEAPLEKWLRDRVIGRIPGADDAGE
jgi:sporulation protein YlmC with PRC-barrel domain